MHRLNSGISYLLVLSLMGLLSQTVDGQCQLKPGQLLPGRGFFEPFSLELIGSSVPLNNLSGSSLSRSISYLEIRRLETRGTHSITDRTVLPFFCRIESLREDQAKMGLKFRLGQVPSAR